MANAWRGDRPVHEVVSTEGVVAANDPRAAQAGAAMLARGGSAVDAAVATAFALAVTEQHLSGLGGGAWIVGCVGPSGEAFCIDGAITAPAAAHEQMFQVQPGTGPTGFYGWPGTVDDANIMGGRSIGVPGAVAALCQAHTRYGRLPLSVVLEPAIALAADGHEVDWLTSALTTSAALELALFPTSAEVFLPGGFPLRGPAVGPGQWFRQPRLAATMERLAAGGQEAFYSRIGADIAASVQEGGGVLTAADFAGYRARAGSPAQARVAGVDLLGPLNTGFPTMVQVLQLAAALVPEGAPDVRTWARAMDLAFADRFSRMSTDPAVDVPWDELMSANHARDLLAGNPDAAETKASSGCTSHLTVVDRDGTVVSVTQTVLDLFGSRFVEPTTGILLNDGMLYFDPRPGTVNSIRPGLPGLAAVSPTIVVREGVPVAAMGASGGRRIITAMAQVVRRLLDGEPLADALMAPRLHVESGKAFLDPRLGAGAVEKLAEQGLEVTVAAELPTTFHYARANGVQRTGTSWTGAADYCKPFGLASG